MMKTRLKDKISRLAASLGVFAVALGFAPQAQAADVMWTGGSASEWSAGWATAPVYDGKNWYVVDYSSSDVAVTFTDKYDIGLNDLKIINGTDYTVNFSAPNSTSDGLTIGWGLWVGTNTGKGKLKIDSGTYVINGLFEVGEVNGGEGHFTLDGATVTGNGVGYWAWGNNTKAIVDISGGTLTMNAGLYVMWDGSNNSTINITGGTLDVNGKMEFGTNSANSTGSINIGTQGGDGTSKGVLEVGSKAEDNLDLCFGNCSGTTVNVNLYAGGTLKAYNVLAGAGTSNLTLDGGTLQALGTGSTALVGSGINVTVGSNGGTIDTAYDVTIAAAVTGSGNITKKGSGKLTFTGDMSGYTGTITVDGGTVEFSSVTCNPNNIVLNSNTGMTVNGGTFNVATSGNYNDPWIGNGATFTMTSGNATFGTNGSPKWTKIGGGTVNLDGGELAVCRFTCEGDATINFNGGTLASYGAGTDFGKIIGGRSNDDAGTITLKVLAGGAIIDTKSYDTTITPVMASGVTEGTDGGLVKKGSGTLTLAAVPTFNGGVKLQDGSIKIPNGYSSVNVTTDVDGYEVVPSVGESSTTYTLVKPAITWTGATDSNWNTPGNWSGNAVPTANDDVVIPSGSTITLSAAAYAATITADETVTIAVSGNSAFTYAEGLKSALKNSQWKGTFKISGFNNSTSAPDIDQYSNEASTFCIDGSTFRRFKGYIKGNWKIIGDVTTVGNWTTNGRPDYLKSYGVTIEQLSGTGKLSMSGDTTNWHAIYCNSGVGFAGSLYGAYNCIMFDATPSDDKWRNTKGSGFVYVASGYTAGLGLGATWNPSTQIDIAGTVKVQEGAATSATVATLKAPTVTFENGAAIQFAKLGTIAVVDANGEAITPSGSGTVTVSIADGITPEAATTTLISWAAAPENLDFELASGSSSEFSLEKTAVGLVLKYAMPEAQIYVNGAASTTYQTAAQGIAAAIEAGEANYDYLVVSANVAYETTTENLANLKFKLATGVVVTITTSDKNMYEYEVAGTTGDDGITTYAIANTGCEYTWIGAVEGLNWSNTGNWQYNDNGTMKTASRKLTSDDTATIPANKTVNLTEKSYAASIVADKTVVIASSGFGNAEGLRGALQDADWHGTYRVLDCNMGTTDLTLPNYGNSGSAIEFAGTCTIYRFTNNNKNGAFNGEIKVSGAMTETKGFPTGSGTGNDTNKTTTFGKLSGNGTWSLTLNDSNYAQWCNIGDASEFAGSLSLVSGIGSFYSGGSKVNYGIAVGSGKTFGLGLGAVWAATPSEGSIAVSGTLKVQEGADATAATATLKASTVTFNDGAAIQFAKLGTIAIQDAEGNPAVPAGSGTVTVSFGDGVVLTDGAILMTWASAPENLTFVFADSTLDTNWDLVASASGLTLKATGIAPGATSPAYATEAAATAALSQYSVVLTDAQKTQGLDAEYYTVETYQIGDQWYVRAVLADGAKPEVAEGATVEGSTVTIPATKLKKGLYYRVVSSAEAAGTGTKTTGAWSSEPYSGSGSLSLTAELPAEGVLYYAIEASDAAE